MAEPRTLVRLRAVAGRARPGDRGPAGRGEPDRAPARAEQGEEPRLRVVACPPSGAGALYYRPLLAAGVSVWAARYPGRESRLREPFAASIVQLAHELADAVEALPAEPVPTVLLGHSMGVGVAAHTAALLAHRGVNTVDLLVLSAREAPGSRGDDQGFRELIRDDRRLTEWIARLGGTPAELLADEDFMAMQLPIMRADLLTSLEDNVMPTGPDGPLDLPLLLLCGDQDPVVDANRMAGWSGLVTGPVTVASIAGGHDAVVQDISWVARALELVRTRRQTKRYMHIYDS